MLATTLTILAGIFLLWRAGGRLAYLCGWRAYSTEYHWWFAWRPVWLYGPDEWDRRRSLRTSARVMWLRWVMRMPTTPKFYHVLPNWSDSRFTMLERPWWMFWRKPIHATWRRRACDKCGARSRHAVCNECPYHGPAPVGYDRPDGITIEQAIAMEPR